MKTEWSKDGSMVEIYGDYSPHPVILSKEVVGYFGDIETAYHSCQTLRKEGYCPKASGISTMKDLTFSLENKERNSQYQNRYWVYGTIYPTVNEYVRGYYHIEGKYAVFSGGTKVELQNQ